MAKTAQIPDWWAREKQVRQVRILIFLVLLLALIGFYYMMSAYGRIGSVAGISFDTARYIAFVHQNKEGETDLYAVREDGTDLRLLTREDDNSTKQDPAWTVDGKNILYSSNLGGNRVSQIYILGKDSPRQLTHGTNNKYAPIAAPDGKSCAFTTQGAVKVINLNGTDLYQIMPPPRAGSGENEANPAASFELSGPFLSARFSPDGEAIAGVQSPRPEEMQLNPGDEGLLGEQVARVLPPNADRALLLPFNGRAVSVDWEPSGKRLLIGVSEMETVIDKKPELLHGLYLWNMSQPKEAPHPLLMARSFTVAPRNAVWSPDGKYVAFEVWRIRGEGERELRGIMVMPADGPTVAVRTPAEAEAMLTQVFLPVTADRKPQRPLWSPTGDRLLFEGAKADGTRDLWVIHADGTNPINLTAKLGGDNAQAAWSPRKAAQP